MRGFKLLHSNKGGGTAGHVPLGVTQSPPPCCWRWWGAGGALSGGPTLSRLSEEARVGEDVTVYDREVSDGSGTVEQLREGGGFGCAFHGGLDTARGPSCKVAVSGHISVQSPNSSARCKRQNLAFGRPSGRN